jgi:hypothetical protein
MHVRLDLSCAGPRCCVVRNTYISIQVLVGQHCLIHERPTRYCENNRAETSSLHGRFFLSISAITCCRPRGDVMAERNGYVYS